MTICFEDVANRDLSLFLVVCRGGSEEEEVLQAKAHYRQALVDGVVFNLNDDAYVKVS